MKINTILISLGLLILMSSALLLAMLITPINFLLIQIALIGGFFIFYLLYRDITNVVIVWLLFLLFVIFSKISAGIDMPNLSFDRVIWSLMIFYYMFHVITGKISFSRRGIEILMFILFMLGFISIIAARGLNLSRATLDTCSTLFNAYAVPFSIFLIAKDFINEERKIRKLFAFLSLVLLYLSITAVFEHFRFDYLVFPRDIMNPGLGIHFGRSRGPFLQAAINGTVIGMLSIVNLYMAMNTRLPHRLFFIFTAVISPIAMFFTYTRASWLGFMLAFMFMLIINRRFRKYIGLLIFCGAVIIAVFNSKIVDMEKVASRSSSISPIYDRINLYHTYAAMFAEKPLFGFGFGNFGNYSHEYFSRVKSDNPYNIVIPEMHDSFSGTLVELGVCGFVVFMSILIAIFRKSLFLFRKMGDEGFLGRGIVIVFWGIGIVYVANALAVDMKFHQFQNAVFYMTAGIIAGLYQRTQKSEQYSQQ
ncbi:MAG: O-antigen ligase family protein [Candidatus Omnitrophota bacterium]|nr:O-antigen ligase family protein [Candidatus Omnitrophota bacterium]